ncbi:MAG: nucleotidyl transferase AbiEii/AbiGii toxin family protein [Candidatus Micrarchaeota archaeon]
MNEIFHRKYKRVLEILPDVAECVKGRLALVGGTALALFYLNHRVSVDLDFVALDGNDVKLKEELKGCITKKGYRTIRGAYKNQFVIQFEDTSIKVEVLGSEYKIQRFEERVFGNSKIKVASLEDLLRMKKEAYENRKEARDLFDIFCMMKRKDSDFEKVKKLIAKFGAPKEIDEISQMASNPHDFELFKKVLLDAP